MNIELIKIFGVAVSEPNEIISFADVNRESVKKGYIVHPDVCTRSVKKYIDSINVDYNSTFYKTFEDVTSKSRFELFIDQAMHYATTYGTDFTAEAYVPNEDYKDTKEFVFDNYKVIMPVTSEEMCNKCLDLFYSGIALKQETIDACSGWLRDCVRSNKFNADNIDFDKIQNREALVVMCDMFHKYPTNTNSLFRYIIYKTTATTMIIKNRALIEAIKANANKFDFRELTDKQIVQLSTIFYRFKPLFLAFKAARQNKYAINKIRRLAEVNHKPLKIGVFESLLTADSLKAYANKNPFDKELVEKELENCTNFKLVRLLQLIKEKTAILMAAFDNSGKAETKNMYIIRNGKVYFKDGVCYYTKEEIINIVSTIGDLYNMIKDKLVGNLKKNIEEGKEATYIPIDCLDIACPVSEKNFIGNYPNGSRYKLVSSNIFGVYWRNEWGTRDFDLSFSDIDGNRISWNSNYYNNRGTNEEIVYSGDMTNADPHATECIRFTDKVCNGIFSVNRYNGNDGSKFEIFMAQTDKFDSNKCYAGREYMVNPNDIVFKSEAISDKVQKMLGIVCDGYMYLSNLGTGNCIVARYGETTPADIYNIYVLKSHSVLYLYDILEEAGYKKVTDEEKTDDTIDFRTASKSDIIALFS